MNPLHAFYKTENFVNFSNFNFIDGLSKVAKCFSYSQIAIVVIFKLPPNLRVLVWSITRISTVGAFRIFATDSEVRRTPV